MAAISYKEVGMVNKKLTIGRLQITDFGSVGVKITLTGEKEFSAVMLENEQAAELRSWLNGTSLTASESIPIDTISHFISMLARDKEEKFLKRTDREHLTKTVNLFESVYPELMKKKCNRRARALKR